MGSAPVVWQILGRFIRPVLMTGNAESRYLRRIKSGDSEETIQTADFLHMVLQCGQGIFCRLFGRARHRNSALGTGRYNRETYFFIECPLDVSG